MDKKDIDELSNIETTGHEWDGIKELNTPLPRWWLYMFYASVVWAIGYWIVMPSWPLVSSYLPGVAGISQRANALAAYESNQALRLANAGAIGEIEVAAIQNDQALLEFALAQGKAAFGDNCAPCHGTGAAGSRGYPNLNDDDWLWGGMADDIYQTIRFGIRSGHDEERIGDMPHYGRDELLQKDEINAVANYAFSLSGGKTEEGADLAKGKVVFEENCATCHGEDGKGMIEVGAPNLTDQIWLHGDMLVDVKAQINVARNGVMPFWEKRLDPITLKSLAVYVHSLGGGQ